jgi:tetratricopeptide (TPR) repeat protein
MGHARDAAGAFTTVLRLAPNDAAAAYNLANALKVDGKLDEALFWYRGALNADPTDVSKVH